MNEKNNRGIEVWNRVLRSALSLPEARINRAAYLTKELSKYFGEDTVRQAIETTPAVAGIPSSAIRSIAQSSISWHRAGVTATSFVASLPGGWWMAATIPTDLAQFFWHVVVILQKVVPGRSFELGDITANTLGCSRASRRGWPQGRRSG